MTGPSVALEPGIYAIRRDLAEIAVADRIFAQHYVEPVAYTLRHGTDVRRRPASDADVRGTLAAGARFHVLDLGVLWAWGRGDAGPVGYVCVSDLVEPS